MAQERNSVVNMIFKKTFNKVKCHKKLVNKVETPRVGGSAAALIKYCDWGGMVVQR